MFNNLQHIGTNKSKKLRNRHWPPVRPFPTTVGRDGAVESAESPHAPRMVRYIYSTGIAIQQASDGTESNGVGMSEA